MKIHLKIIASVNLLLGNFLLVSFILGNYSFFTSSLFSWNDSVLNFSLAEKLGSVKDKYLEFFALYGMSGFDLLINVFWILLTITFGIGLLKSKKWAKWLGFVIILLNGWAFILTAYDGNLSIFYVLQIIFTFYMLFVLTSPKTNELLR